MLQLGVKFCRSLVFLVGFRRGALPPQRFGQMEMGLRIAWRQSDGGAELRDGSLKSSHLQQTHARVGIKRRCPQVGFIAPDLSTRARFASGSLGIAQLPEYARERS